MIHRCKSYFFLVTAWVTTFVDWGLVMEEVEFSFFRLLLIAPKSIERWFEHHNQQCRHEWRPKNLKERSALPLFYWKFQFEVSVTHLLQRISTSEVTSCPPASTRKAEYFSIKISEIVLQNKYRSFGKINLWSRHFEIFTFHFCIHITCDWGICFSVSGA